jgi:chemotaxis signal transduction protein
MVREAARVPRIEPLPGSPPEVLGVAMVRGAPVGVVDASLLLPSAERVGEEGAEARRKKKVLVVLKRPLALVVDRIEGVRTNQAPPFRFRSKGSSRVPTSDPRQDCLRRSVGIARARR